MATKLVKACLAGILAVVGATAFGAPASAAQPEDWGMSFQIPATSLGAQVSWFESYTLIIITAVTLFVMALLAIVILRFNRSRNPQASGTSHNTMIEVVWTIVPVLILVMIAFPSFRLLYQQETIPEPDMTVRATGAQWYWEYEYRDTAMEGTSFVSYMLSDDERGERMDAYGLSERDAPRNLAVDYPLVVPAGATVKVEVTSNDVNHAFGVPSFGIKRDAIPGRMNQTWFEISEPGVYYGQCYELCGRNHSYMPVEIVALDQERYDEWAAAAQDSMSAANELQLSWRADERRSQSVAALDAAQ